MWHGGAIWGDRGVVGVGGVVTLMGGDTVLLDMRSPLENAEPFVVSTKDTTPSRWVWRLVTSALRVNDVERAHREKQLVEGLSW